jgi:hypothetical protein
MRCLPGYERWSVEVRSRTEYGWDASSLILRPIRSARERTHFSSSQALGLQHRLVAAQQKRAHVRKVLFQESTLRSGVLE